MPSAMDILAGLEVITNRWTPLAIGWHVYIRTFSDSARGLGCGPRARPPAC